MLESIRGIQRLFLIIQTARPSPAATVDKIAAVIAGLSQMYSKRLEPVFSSLAP